MLTGAETENVRKWHHDEVSTYGVGRDTKRADWLAIGRELIRFGYVRQSSEKFSVIELTEDGRAALIERRKVTLTKPAVVPDRSKKRVGDIPCDELLFERLRSLRRKLADERDIPAYIIFSDVALREMANRYPTSEADFARISGVGRQKLQEFSAVFMAEIIAYLQSNPRQIFADSFTAPAPAPKLRMNDTTRETLKLFAAGKSVEQIAGERGFSLSTIYGHLANAIELGEKIELRNLISEEQERLIQGAFAKAGTGSLSAVKELLGEAIDYGQLKIYRVFLASKI